jgi:hypothetical protein
VQWGGLLAARAIKLLASKNAQQRTRDKWWAQLRGEVKSHAVALDCNFVVGYAETTAIFEDICLLTCYGTAARLSWAPSPHTGSVGSIGGGPFLPPNADLLDDMVFSSFNVYS